MDHAEVGDLSLINPSRPATKLTQMTRDRTAEESDDLAVFTRALRVLMKRHGDTSWRISQVMRASGSTTQFRTIQAWTKGSLPRLPASTQSLIILAQRYRRSDDYLLKKVIQQHDAATALSRHFTRQQMQQARWHVPRDFALRSATEQTTIVTWIKETIIAGATDFRSYVTRQKRAPYALRFPGMDVLMGQAPPLLEQVPDQSTKTHASETLISQMGDFVQFKTCVYTKTGDRRLSRWSRTSADQVVKRFALMFGALSAPANGPLRGLGIKSESLSMALLVIPEVWDWYIEWHRSRRGFFTMSELDLLAFATAMTHPHTGWLTQRPRISASLVEIPDLLPRERVEDIMTHWSDACAVLYSHAHQRLKDIRPLTRIHRDSFEPIRPVLVSDSPVNEYRRITTELLARLPSLKGDPRGVAEAIRGYLMLRFGLHLGLRQRNLRELLLSQPGSLPTQTVRLESRRCGELRWQADQEKWVVFIPALAFKNARSSFFGGRPFFMQLPDVEELYRYIDLYIRTCRPILLGSANDPGTFFIRATKGGQGDPRMDGTAFYSAFRTIIERYGVYNPYTGRGAIKGLLPHGPHSIRDVLATHVLKRTGSFRQAGYAIQDAPETVERSYARFLPEDKSRIAARILDAEWQ